MGVLHAAVRELIAELRDAQQQIAALQKPATEATR